MNEEIRGSEPGLIVDPRAPLPPVLQEQLSAPVVHFFLDFDGTLVPISDLPDLAQLSPEMKDTLQALKQNGRARVVIVSGRNRAYLEKELVELGVEIAAEHGAAFYSPARGSWRLLGAPASSADREAVRGIMEVFEGRFPGCFVEEKEFGFALHYRNAPNVTDAELRVLVGDLSQIRGEACVLEGKKIVEISFAGVNKGSFVWWYISAQKNENGNREGIVTLGDDTTDEFMFGEVTRLGGVAIHVGTNTTRAPLSLPSQEDVLSLMRRFAQG